MAALNLLGSTSRVETPFIKVKIGDYTFGVYEKSKQKLIDNDGKYQLFKTRYPNYIESLSIEKVNGALNLYSLNLIYQIGENDDPNFFEKVFSSVANTRKIQFSYGDLSLPTNTFKNEEALITDVTSRFNIKDASNDADGIIS